MGQRISVRGEPCTRALDEQVADRSGIARRADHPRLERLELLSDGQLAELRARFPLEMAALEAPEAAEARARERAECDARERDDLDGEGEAFPATTTVVCLACCAHEVVTMPRAWPVDRAMMRTGMPERDVLAVMALLAAAYAEVRGEPPHLDALHDADLRVLADMAERRATPIEVRDLLGDPQSEPRLTRKALEQMLRDRE